LGRPLSAIEARNLRVENAPPRNIGCAYATQYCETYW
jgi:hypothetical protein